MSEESKNTETELKQLNWPKRLANKQKVELVKSIQEKDKRLGTFYKYCGKDNWLSNTVSKVNQISPTNAIRKGAVKTLNASAKMERLGKRGLKGIDNFKKLPREEKLKLIIQKSISDTGTAATFGIKGIKGIKDSVKNNAKNIEKSSKRGRKSKLTRSIGGTLLTATKGIAGIGIEGGKRIYSGIKKVSQTINKGLNSGNNLVGNSMGQTKSHFS